MWRHSLGKHQPIAVDVGGCAIRMMQLGAVGDRMKVSAAAEIEYPPNLRRDEERQSFVVDSIRQSLKDNGFKGRRAVTIVPNADVQFKSFRIPQMPHEEMDQAVLFEAEERFALPEGEADYRFLDAGEIRQGQETRNEIIAMCSTAETLRRHMNIFNDVGLICTATEVSPCAVVRCFECGMDHSQAPDQGRIYADMGYHATRITITSGGRIIFVKSIAMGGAKLDELAAVKLNLSIAEAAQLRRELNGCQSGPEGSDQSSVPTDIVDTAVGAVGGGLEQLAKEIGLCLRYYAVTFRGVRPSQLTCSGGLSHDRQLLKTVSEVTGMKAVPESPFNDLDASELFSETELKTGLAEWATVAGLALKELSPVETAEATS